MIEFVWDSELIGDDWVISDSEWANQRQRRLGSSQVWATVGA